MENDNLELQQDVIEEQAVEHVDQVTEQEPAPVEEPVQKTRQNTSEKNFKELRLAKERAEKEKEELLEKLSRYEQDKNNESSYSDHELIEGKHLRKEINSLKKQIKEYETRTASITEEVRLKARYVDFDAVVTPDAIEKLKTEDPEFSETIATSSASLYSRGASVYKRIKELGIYVNDKYEKEKEIAQKNSAKPRPLNSVSPQQGDGPLSMANAFANGLTEEVKHQLWKEMQDAAKRY